MKIATEEAFGLFFTAAATLVIFFDSREFLFQYHGRTRVENARVTGVCNPPLYFTSFSLCVGATRRSDSAESSGWNIFLSNQTKQKKQKFSACSLHFPRENLEEIPARQVPSCSDHAIANQGSRDNGIRARGMQPRIKLERRIGRGRENWGSRKKRRWKREVKARVLLSVRRYDIRSPYFKNIG